MKGLIKKGECVYVRVETGAFRWGIYPRVYTFDIYNVHFAES